MLGLLLTQRDERLRTDAEQKIFSSFTFSLSLFFSLSSVPTTEEASCCSATVKELTAGEELVERMREQRADG